MVCERTHYATDILEAVLTRSLYRLAERTVLLCKAQSFLYRQQ